MSYSLATDNMIKLIQSKLEHASYNQMKLYPWLKTVGAYRKIGEGLIKHTITKIEKMEPGELVGGLSSLPENTPGFNESTTTLATYGCKIVIPMRILDQWRNNNLIDVSLQDIINEQMKSVLVQVEQFCAWGDSMADPATDDAASGEAVFSGIMNGGSSQSAGDGEDDDMAAAGDYQSTISNFCEDLEDNGFDGSNVYIISDNTTYREAQRGNHQLQTVDFRTEAQAVLEMEDVVNWLYSVNFKDSSGNSRITVTQPMTGINPQTGEKENAYRLLESYSFKVIPLNGGNINSQLNYEYAVVWSGAMEFINSDAIINSGGTKALSF